MKRILIVNNNMHIGGVQKALANLLAEIAPRYDVTLMLFAKKGALMQEIPQSVRVIEANAFVRALGLTHAEARQEGIMPLLWRGALVVATRIFKTRVVFWLLSRMQHIDGAYDLAISYLQNGAETCFYGGCAELVLHAANAKRKVCFVHCDFERYEGRCAYNAKTLLRFDRVAAVSDAVAKRLIRVVPQLQGKVTTVHNCHSAGRILELSKAYEAPRTDGSVNLFSAARLRHEKGIARMIPIFSRMRDIDFVWRIAGDGEDRQLIEAQIAAYGLQDKIRLLGNLQNPYPYFRAADALLVPSYDEAAPMVFGEAQILGTPIITTDTASAQELVQTAQAGWVIANDDEGIFKELSQLLRDFDSLRWEPCRWNNDAAVAEFDKLTEG